MTKTFSTVYLALGSNISPRVKTVHRCISTLKKQFPDCFKSSALYQTAPYQNSDQKPYINACLKFDTVLQPTDLLIKLLNIEQQLGRVRSNKKWDNRVIDIDILLFDQLVLNSEQLTIPHYDLCNRDFFLIPLIELSPDLINPRSGQKITEELANLDSSLKTFPEVI